jgi:AGCS family alanine or glycine:cation symporter
MTRSPRALTLYRLLSGGVMVMYGALVSLSTVWTLIDLCMALLTACNLVAIVQLGKYAFRLLDDYRQQKRQGVSSPTFHRSQMPELEGQIECWE